MNCPNCQLELPDQREFCPDCGFSFENPDVDRPASGKLAGLIGILIVAIVIAFVVHRTEHRAAVLITLALHIVTVILHLVPYVAIGAWRKAQIEEIGLFLGPAVLHMHLGRWPFRINCLPLGGYVRFTNVEEPEPGWLPRTASSTGRSFQELHWWERILLNGSPIFFLLAISAAVLGPARAWNSFIATYWQIVQGLQGGQQVAYPSLTAFIKLIEGGSFLTALAILATKETAFNCFPLPAFNGGAISKELIPATLRRRIPRNYSAIAQLISFFLILGLAIYWIYAFLFAAGFPRPKSRNTDTEPAAFYLPDLTNFSTSSRDGSDG